MSERDNNVCKWAASLVSMKIPSTFLPGRYLFLKPCHHYHCFSVIFPRWYLNPSSVSVSTNILCWPDWPLPFNTQIRIAVSLILVQSQSQHCRTRIPHQISLAVSLKNLVCTNLATHKKKLFVSIRHLRCWLE